MQRILDRSAPGHGASRSPIGRLRDYAIPAVWVVLAPASVYAPKMTVVLLFASLLGFRDFSSTARVAKRLLATPAGLSLAALVLWCVISTTWAPGGVAAALTAARMAGVMLVGFIAFAIVQRLDGKARCLAERCFCLFGVVALSLLLLEIVTGGFVASVLKGRTSDNLNFTNRGSAILAVLAFPVLVAIGARPRGLVLAVAFAALSVSALFVLPMFASFVALGLGLLAFLIGHAFKRRGLYAIALAASLVLGGAPWLSVHGPSVSGLSEQAAALPYSWQHRLLIWGFASTKALRRPILGHGFDASRVIGRESGVLRLDDGTDAGAARLGERLPLHPHNLAIQVWLELGLVGIAACIGIVLGLVRSVAASNDRRLAVAMVSGTFTAFVCLASISYGAWQNWWLATGWLAAIACALVARGLPAGADGGAARPGERASA